MYIVFCFVGLLWMSLELILPSLDDFGLPFGSLWGTLGYQGVFLGVTLASLGLAIGPYRIALGPGGEECSLTSTFGDRLKKINRMIILLDTYQALNYLTGSIRWI